MRNAFDALERERSSIKEGAVMSAGDFDDDDFGRNLSDGRSGPNDDLHRDSLRERASIPLDQTEPG